jgi:hypothetical protein
MPDVQRFPFVEARDAFGDVDVVPRLLILPVIKHHKSIPNQPIKVQVQ